MPIMDLTDRWDGALSRRHRSRHGVRPTAAVPAPRAGASHPPTLRGERPHDVLTEHAAIHVSTIAHPSPRAMGRRSSRQLPYCTPLCGRVMLQRAEKLATQLPDASGFPAPVSFRHNWPHSSDGSTVRPWRVWYFRGTSPRTGAVPASHIPHAPPSPVVPGPTWPAAADARCVHR